MKNIGVLLPLASLPSNHGIGDFGYGAFLFIDYLKRHNYKYWQILPLNPLGPGWSPYLTTCQRAIDYRYISLDALTDEGLIDKTPIFNKYNDKVTFYDSGLFKLNILKDAYINFKKLDQKAFNKFIKNNQWALDYGVYEILHAKNNNVPWNEWKKEDKGYFKRNKTIPAFIKDEVYFYAFLQFKAYSQLQQMMNYAHKNGIKIIGDIPFYVGYDSLDCWKNQEMFDLKKDGTPKTVGGVPPDYFSETGQLWGNPCYNFKRMKEDNYSFLVDRVKSAMKTCDILRLDHFRAFYDYWSIPYGNDTAINGKWKKGPSDEFFNALFKNPKIDIIAEDLGLLSPGVIKLRDRFNLPGMNVFQFTIFDDGFKDNGHLIVYSGTHDNDTLLGFYESLSDFDKERLKKKIKYKDGDVFDSIMKYILKMKSKITIISMVDILRLSSTYRINTPGTVGSPNFEFKVKEEDLLC